jgi:putative membrane protein
MHRIIGLLRLLALLLIVLVGLVLHTRNSQPVTLDLYFLKVTQPLSLLLAVTVALGALLGIVAAIPRLLSGRRVNRRLRRELKQQAALGTQVAEAVVPGKDAT